MAWGIEGHPSWCIKVFQRKNLDVSIKGQISAAEVRSVYSLLLCPPCWLLNLPLFLPNCHNHSSLPCFPRLLTCFTASVLPSDHWSLCPYIWCLRDSFLHASPGSCSMKLRDIILFCLIYNCLKHTLLYYLSHALVFALCWLSSSLVEISSFSYRLQMC